MTSWTSKHETRVIIWKRINIWGNTVDAKLTTESYTNTNCGVVYLGNLFINK